ncbi:MAG: hypothetical protein AAFU67_12730 [Bacteroidota bacterium]
MFQRVELALHLSQLAKGASFTQEYVAVEFDQFTNPIYYQDEPTFGLYGSLRGEYRITDLFSFVSRFSYFPLSGNELNNEVAKGYIQSSTFQLRFGINYILSCYR